VFLICLRQTMCKLMSTPLLSIFGSEKLVLFSSPLWQPDTALGLSVENFDGLPTDFS